MPVGGRIPVLVNGKLLSRHSRYPHGEITQAYVIQTGITEEAHVSTEAVRRNTISRAGH